jgi:hypothetical protein
MRCSNSAIAATRFAAVIALTACAPKPDAPKPLPVWEGKIDLSIATDSDRQERILLNPQKIAADRKGRILVSDYDAHNVKVYSSTGEFLYTFGRRGNGPGEHRVVDALTVDDSGVWINDGMLQRMTHMLLTDSAAVFDRMVKTSANGYCCDRIASARVDGEIIGEAGSPEQNDVTITHFDSGGVIRNRIRVPLPDVGNVPALRVSIRGREEIMTPPFGPRALFAVSRDGSFVTALSGKYEVNWYDKTGKLLRTIRMEAVGRELNSQEKEFGKSWAQAMAKQFGASENAAMTLVPSRLQLLESLGFDDDGRLWVHRSTNMATPNEADVIDSTGALIARATWPSEVGFFSSSVAGMTAYGLQQEQSTQVGSRSRSVRNAATPVRVRFTARSPMN